MSIRRIQAVKTRRIQPVGALVGAMLYATMLVSCAGEPDDLAAYMEEVKARPGVPLEALPQIPQPEEFRYAAGDRSSPFTLIAPGTEVARRAGDGPAPDLAREPEFLEHYSLDTLRMVGSLRRESGLYGLMQTPDGLIHRLAVGDYLGRNHGRVTRISEDEVQLVELVADGNGGYLQRPAAIYLAD